jgi:hypothetical protein
MIRFDANSVLHLEHRHGRRARKDLRQMALMVGIQVLHQDESHPRARRQRFQKLDCGFQSARRRANAGDGEAPRLLPGLRDFGAA